MNKLPMLSEQFFRNYIGMEMLNEKQNFPPHNIEQIDDNHYVLTLAVAGFKKENIKASLVGGKLTIEGTSDANLKQPVLTEFGIPAVQKNYLYKGISFKNFKQEYIISENVIIESIVLDHGLLIVSLEKKIPEADKIKYIEIR